MDGKEKKTSLRRRGQSSDEEKKNLNGIGSSPRGPSHQGTENRYHDQKERSHRRGGDFETGASQGGRKRVWREVPRGNSIPELQR